MSTHKLVPRELRKKPQCIKRNGTVIDSELGTVEIYRRTIAAIPEYSNESLGQNSIDIIKEKTICWQRTRHTSNLNLMLMAGQML